VTQFSTERPTTDALGPATGGMPPAVDLDGTLLNTDTLFEALAEIVRRRPFWTLWQMIQLPFAIARVKARIQSEGRIDIATLPVNEQVLAYCRQSKAREPAWSGSCRRRTRALSTRSLSTSASLIVLVGSDGAATNNKGSAKGAFLQKVAPEGFEYVGDSRADLKVWLKAKSASIVGGGDLACARRREDGRQESARRFDRPKRGSRRLDQGIAPASVGQERPDPSAGPPSWRCRSPILRLS